MGASEEKRGGNPATSTMRRELSVEDLFVPFSSLDVRLHSSSTSSSSSSSSSTAAAAVATAAPSGDSGFPAPSPSTAAINVSSASPFATTFSSSASSYPIAAIESNSPRGNLLEASFIGERLEDAVFANAQSQMPGLGVASTCFQSPGFTQLDPSRYLTVSIPKNSTVSCPSQKWRIDAPQEGNAVGLYAMDAQIYPSVLKERDRTCVDQESKSLVVHSPRTETLHSPISRGSVAPRGSGNSQDAAHQLPNSSNSDEDQLVIDDRKQRRMLSNRESARRSRLRKQQHLDDLRTHVAQLRAENSQMMSRFNVASQHYAQLTEENRILRTQALELSHQLQRLHHTAASQYPDLLQAVGHDSARKPPGPSMRVEARHLPPLSQPVVSTPLH